MQLEAFATLLRVDIGYPHAETIMREELAKLKEPWCEQFIFIRSVESHGKNNY